MKVSPFCLGALLFAFVALARGGEEFTPDAELTKKIFDSFHQQYEETIRPYYREHYPSTIPPPEGFRDVWDLVYLQPADQYKIEMRSGQKVRENMSYLIQMKIKTLQYGSLESLDDKEQYYCISSMQSSSQHIVVMNVKSLRVTCIYFIPCG